jgi:hypothetical protein
MFFKLELYNLHYYDTIFNIKLEILSPLRKLPNERKVSLTDIAKPIFQTVIILKTEGDYDTGNSGAT